MPRVTMYSTAFCPFCQRAEQLLRAKGVQHINKISVDLEPEQREIMMQKTGRRTVPQIYIGTHYVGGYDELLALEKNAQLDKLLSDE